MAAAAAVATRCSKMQQESGFSVFPKQDKVIKLIKNAQKKKLKLIKEEKLYSSRVQFLLLKKKNEMNKRASKLRGEEAKNSGDDEALLVCGTSLDTGSKKTAELPLTYKGHKRTQGFFFYTYYYYYYRDTSLGRRKESGSPPWSHFLEFSLTFISNYDLQQLQRQRQRC